MSEVNKTEDFQNENYTPERIKISHSDLSVDMNYDEKIDAYDPIPFFNYLDVKGIELRATLPKNSRGKSLPDLQILSKFFMDCKDRFKGIPAKLIYDELTDYLEMNPKDMYENLSRTIKNQLLKELKQSISLDKYNKKVKQEFI